jgi:hypothetical protein
MKRLGIATAVLLAAPTVFAQAPLRVSALKVGEPVRVAELDMDKLKGQPYRMAWSPDGSQLYVQTLEGNINDVASGKAQPKLRHYLFSTEPGSAKKDAPGQPDWVAEYWNAKYGQYAPGSTALKIDVKEEQRTERATNAPVGGDLAKGSASGGSGTSAGAGTSAGDVSAANAASQILNVRTMVYKGEKIGEFINTVIVPGLTYGWGPKGTNVIAFSALRSGKVVILDEQGGKLEIGGSKDAVLPAWSPDAKRLAWLQKDGKKKYQLQIAAVSGS